MNKKQFVSKDFTTVQAGNCRVTYCAIRGAGAKPVLTLIAGQHGMEHIGPAVLEDLIDDLAQRPFRGTVNICPCANPLALALDYEFYPEREDLHKLKNYYYSRFRHDYCVFGMGRKDGGSPYNMNRLWNRPDASGVAADITRWLWKEICEPAHLIIDFHALQADKPLIYNCDEKSEPLAVFFGIEAIYPTGSTSGANNKPWKLSSQASSDHRFVFTVEFSCQHDYRLADIDLGRNGVLNVMRGIGMLEGEVRPRNSIYRVVRQHALTTAASGHIHYRFGEYERVAKDEIVFTVSDLNTLAVVDRVKAPCDGIMDRRTFRPISMPQEPVCHLAEVELLAAADKLLDKVNIIL